MPRAGGGVGRDPQPRGRATRCGPGSQVSGADCVGWWPRVRVAHFLRGAQMEVQSALDPATDVGVVEPVLFDATGEVVGGGRAACHPGLGILGDLGGDRACSSHPGMEFGVDEAVLGDGDEDEADADIAFDGGDEVVSLAMRPPGARLARVGPLAASTSICMASALSTAISCSVAAWIRRCWLSASERPTALSALAFAARRLCPAAPRPGVTSPRPRAEQVGPSRCAANAPPSWRAGLQASPRAQGAPSPRRPRSR